MNVHFGSTIQAFFANQPDSDNGPRLHPCHTGKTDVLRDLDAVAGHIMAHNKEPDFDPAPWEEKIADLERKLDKMA